MDRTGIKQAREDMGYYSQKRATAKDSEAQADSAMETSKTVRKSYGERITSLYGLEWAEANHKAVVCPQSPMLQKPRPASFVLNISARVVLQCIRKGLYIYERGKHHAEDTSNVPGPENEV